MTIPIALQGCDRYNFYMFAHGRTTFAKASARQATQPHARIYCSPFNCTKSALFIREQYIQPEIGLVIRYDYLWRDEERAGRQDGAKDRPCAIILMSRKLEDKSRDVYVCAITHSPPQHGETAVEIPYKVARHLNLDSDRMWVKTQEVNKFRWEEGCIPFGVTRIADGKWSYGMIPKALGQKIHEQAMGNSRKNALDVVKRDDGNV